MVFCEILPGCPLMVEGTVDIGLARGLEAREEEEKGPGVRAL